MNSSVPVPASRPDVSVVVSTYNRANVLPRAIRSLRDQDLDWRRYEIVVVDNNSTDHTRQVVESFTGGSPRVVYVFEARQGASYGRNAGIAASSAPAIAFTDDDVEVSRNWLSTILTVLAEHPEADGVGGKVLPNQTGRWPSWLSKEHWSPLALVDYGDEPLYVNAAQRLCLVTANAAYRREVFERIGMFSPHVQTLGREVATEDHELLLRLWRAGGQGLYWPGLRAMTEVPPERLTRAYHRRWHRRHGRFSALMHDEELEETRIGRFLGVPGHIYRRAGQSAALWARSLLRGQRDKAFTHEIGMWFCIGFCRARWTECLSRHRAGTKTG